MDLKEKYGIVKRERDSGQHLKFSYMELLLVEVLTDCTLDKSYVYPSLSDNVLILMMD